MSIDLSRDGYTHEEIKQTLHMVHGSRKVRFRYFLLDREENELAELKSVVSGSIEQSAFSDIKRTAKFTLQDKTYINSDGEKKEIDWHSDRIQVFIEFEVPGKFVQKTIRDDEVYFIMPSFPTNGFREWKGTKKENGWISFSLGIFLISTPTRKEKNQNVYRDIDAYDKLLIIKEDKATNRIFIPSGSSYKGEIKTLLKASGVTSINIEDTDKMLPNDKEYEPGESILTIVNDLASDISFTQIWVDEYGYFRTGKYESPSKQPTDYEYTDNEISVTTPDTEEELDLFELPNVFTVVVSNPDNEKDMSSTVENNNPYHPRSITNLGRRVVRVEEKNEMADQDSLDDYVERLAENASQKFGKIKFSTAIMPFHGYSNVLRIKNKTLGIDERYGETDWKIDLSPGSTMEHQARRTVHLT